MSRNRVTAVALVTLLTLCSPIASSGTRAATTAPPLSPRQMLFRYFAALNAHNYHAAWRLEAACGVTYRAVPDGEGSFAGRGQWQAGAAHPILASAHVTSIRRLFIRELDRAGIHAYAVLGRYQFDYRSVPWANDKHVSGFHAVRIAMWRCDRQWGVEPPYWVVAGGGPLNWN